LHIQNTKGSLKLLIHYAKRSSDILREYGLKQYLARAKAKLKIHYYAREAYKYWIKKNEPEKVELRRQRLRRFTYSPKISIIVPTLNTKIRYFTDMLESVKAQTYVNWELCIADGGTRDKELQRLLRTCTEEDKKIKVMFLNENKGIAGNSNEAISLATGDCIVFLDHDDTLAPFALFEIVEALNENPGADFIYSDEDILSEDGLKRSNPQFKPDWSPDLLRSFNYICHFTAISKKLMKVVGHFRDGYEGSQDHDLFLRATEKANQIVHIPKVLYHWRTHSSSAAMNMSAKTYAFAAGKRALVDHLTRIGLHGTVDDGAFPGSYKTNLRIDDSPLVSIIIPNSNHASDLELCIRSITGKSIYKNFEIIIVENNSTEQSVFKLYDQLRLDNRIKIIEWKEAFNYSMVNNYAAEYANGNILLFLNNDTEIISPDWMDQLLGHALRNDVGAVGGKLYYPDNTIQHAGIILGLGGITGHSHRYFARDSHGYMGRLHVVQNVSAVTGACLMTRKSVFKEVHGFDENYPLAFSDLDYCLKVRARGYLIVWTPYAELYHDESKTRGYEETSQKKLRFRTELELYRKKWKQEVSKSDPYYNVNLTHEKEDFSIRI
jgi:O-antigen biosynthesis protein